MPALGLGWLRFVLVAAIAAGVVVLLGLFDDVVRFGCLAVIVAATVLTSSARRSQGGGWWALMATGAALSVLGAVLAQVAETAGGLVAIVGLVGVLAGSVIGFPAGDSA